MEYSDEDDIVQVYAEDSDPDVAAQSSESEAEHSNIDVREEEHEGHSPMPYYVTPPRTIEHPIKHWYTYDTNTENNSADGSDDESVADKGDSGERMNNWSNHISSRLMYKCHQHISKLQKYWDYITLEMLNGRYYLTNVVYTSMTK